MLRSLIGIVLRAWPALALLTSAVLLAIVHAFQTFGHMTPCELCLRQREVYWLALPVAALALAASRWTRLRALAPWLGGAMALIFAGGAVLAGYHAGVEWHFWPGPQTCSGGSGAATAQALSALLHGAKLSAPRCDQAAWRFLWLSMAGWNTLISAKLAGWSAVWAVWVRKA
jgi:disulfide bond formation protein DsbB